MGHGVYLRLNPEEAVDWASAEEDLRPYYVPSNVWDVVFGSFLLEDDR